MLLAWLALACAPGPGGDRSPATTDTAAPPIPTWHADIAPLLTERCAGCHAADGLAEALPWTEHAPTALAVDQLVASVSAGTMPPFPAATTDLCEPPFPFQGDTRLSAEQVALLAAWADAGAPLGDPATAAPTPAPERFALDRWDLELVPPVPVTVERIESENGRVEDLHLCWAFDLGLTDDAWLTGLEVLPGNDAVVHHVRIDVGNADDAASANADGWFPCLATQFGDRAASWVPGARPYETPPGSGLPLPAGAHLVMSVHYHVPTDVPETDTTRMRVRLQHTPPDRNVTYLRIGNEHVRYEDGTGLQPGPNDVDGAEFVVPADTAGHTESYTIRITDETGPVDVWLVGHHMHYAGVDAILTVQRADPAPGEPREQCLLHVPDWDFDWQLFYAYDDPTGRYLRLHPGDVLALRCTYDTTAANTDWAEVMAQEGLTEPIDLPLSSGTLSEMCASLLGVMTVE